MQIYGGRIPPVGEQAMARRVTMTDVADMAGVSQATVSLVLTHAPNVRISESTRQRVLEAAEKLGYRRRGRMSGRGDAIRAIGLVIDDIETTPFAQLLISGARDRAAEHGALLATFSYAGNEALEAEAVRLMLAASAAGVIYTSLMPQRVRVPALYGRMPLVLLNCYDLDGVRPAVTCGDYEGAYAATRLLIEAGHRRIAHIMADPYYVTAEARERGFRAAMADAGLPVDESLVAIGGKPLRAALGAEDDRPLPPGRLVSTDVGWALTASREVATRILDRPDRPTAIFCFQDRMAYACYDAARLLGLRVPEDVSIVGFDDDAMADGILPPLTTMELPYYDMGARAVDLLLQLDAGEVLPNVPEVVEPRLLSRHSVARLV